MAVTGRPTNEEIEKARMTMASAVYSSFQPPVTSSHDDGLVYVSDAVGPRMVLSEAQWASLKAEA